MDLTDESPRTYEDELHPVEIYLRGNLETRSDIIINHPDVAGYLYLHDGILSKAYFPKKVVDYGKQDKGDFKVIAAATGPPEEYVPFYAPEIFILSDHHHLELSPKRHKDIKTTSFTKYAKEHKKELHIPAGLKKDKDIKNLVILAFPVVLPLLRGQKIVEGKCDDPRITDSFDTEHEIYKTWLELKRDAC